MVVTRAYVVKRFLKFKDVWITVLFTGNIIDNSQTTKQMKELRWKYEITLERLQIFTVKCYLEYNSVG